MIGKEKGLIKCLKFNLSAYLVLSFNLTAKQKLIERLADVN